jgi:hypothetical protein
VAIRKHIETYGLREIEKNQIILLETFSTQTKKDFLEQNLNYKIRRILSSGWLIYAEAKENTPPGVVSTLLKDITVQDY